MLHNQHVVLWHMFRAWVAKVHKKPVAEHLLQKRVEMEVRNQVASTTNEGANDEKQ